MTANAHAALPVHASWASYSPPGSFLLALVLLAIAVLLVWGGTRIRSPIAVPRSSRVVTVFLVAIWLLSSLTFLVAVRAYAIQMRETHLLFRAPKVNVGTLLYAVVSFFAIVYVTRRFGWRVALASGIVGAAAAPMFFELPFDLIVFGKVYPSMPPNPRLYRELFFFPLFLVELSTIALLFVLPPMRVTRNAVYTLAATFVVFTAWAVLGFRYPDDAIPKSLNVISKILCFVAAILLFTESRPAIARSPNESSRAVSQAQS